MKESHLLLCAFAALPALLLVSFSYGHVSADGSVVPFAVIDQGADASSINTRVNYLVTDGAEMAELWQMIYGASSTPPAVDFSRYQVAAVFAGAEPAAGYGIGVSRIADAKALRTVEITVDIPGAACPTAPGATYPYQVIEMPVTTLPLTHAYATSTRACP